MIMLIAIVWFGYLLIKESMEDTEMRSEAARRGYKTYYSNTGERLVSTNQKYTRPYEPVKLQPITYVSPITGEEMKIYK